MPEIAAWGVLQIWQMSEQTFLEKELCCYIAHSPMHILRSLS